VGLVAKYDIKMQPNLIYLLYYQKLITTAPQNIS